MAVDEVSHAQSLTNYSSVFCSAKSTFPHKGRLSVPELAREFKITSIPALFVLRDGEVTDKAVGYRNKEALLELIEG